MITSDAEQAATLLSFGLRAKQIPGRDAEYDALVVRHGQDEEFAVLVRAVASGLGLVVLDVDQDIGIVLAPRPGSVFEVRMDDYARMFSAKERRDTQKVLHGIAHLGIAALSFPRAEDLADDTYVGRVSVEQVDTIVRDTCRVLDERTARDDQNPDPDADGTGLEQTWRVYSRRPEVLSTKDNRANENSTRQIVRKALKYLTEGGLMHQVGEPQDEVYRATRRYQVHVRELASHEAFRELIELGVVPDMTMTTLVGGPVETDRI